MADWNEGAQPGSDLHLWESQWASIEEDADERVLSDEDLERAVEEGKRTERAA